MKQLLRIAAGQVRAAWVLSVAGEIDLSTVDQLDKAVVAAVNEAAGGLVVLDLTEVTFLSSNGMASLLQGNELAATAGIDVRVVVAASGAVRRALEITGLMEFLAIYPTLSDALTL
ncbi:STAS domain-containing protein [Kibdelosporangium phytohabitans]|uniref:Anti-sigma factor antagonist n=1 Tax=Kibdelosporangium phytohabitans TaxID=860235 RepID=A0A0N7F3Y8_9PSEU|nr:STAS domain-containing protein [Kibdelosporangium phytohabitans]ALG09951.1 hypothetical protein AOZ06_26345 [Kibdelosporangium phytohabitans]MBE1468637.1 anti-sigma B factor antagonist [Kibdelosporangium phytohabitans]